MPLPLPFLPPLIPRFLLFIPLSLRRYHEFGETWGYGQSIILDALVHAAELVPGMDHTMEWVNPVLDRYLTTKGQCGTYCKNGIRSYIYTAKIGIRSYIGTQSRFLLVMYVGYE
jgi:hypothetical protein